MSQCPRCRRTNTPLPLTPPPSCKPLSAAQDSDKSRVVSDWSRPPQDARMDGRGPPEAHHNLAAPSRTFQPGHSTSYTPQPSPGAPSDPTNRGTAPDAGGVPEPEAHERREPASRRFSHHPRGQDGAGRAGGGRGWEERREFSGGHSGGRGWDERPEDGRGRGGWNRGRGMGRGESGGRDGDDKVWQRGVRPVVARSDHVRGGGDGGSGRGNRREPGDGSHPRSNHRGGESPPGGPPADSSPAPSPSTTAATGGRSLTVSHPSPVAAAPPPSPAVGSVAAAAAGIVDSADQSQSAKAEPPGRQGSAGGHRAPPPAGSPSLRDAPTGRVPRPRGPSFSGGSNGGEEIDDREAIRARDERERDMAVRQRRSADLTAKAAGEADRRQHAQREAQDSKDADREREKVGRVTVQYSTV